MGRVLRRNGVGRQHSMSHRFPTNMHISFSCLACKEFRCACGAGATEPVKVTSFFSKKNSLLFRFFFPFFFASFCPFPSFLLLFPFFSFLFYFFSAHPSARCEARALDSASTHPHSSRQCPWSNSGYGVSYRESAPCCAELGAAGRRCSSCPQLPPAIALCSSCPQFLIASHSQS